MATNKNITMKQFNGVDYDTLYPKTKVEQVEGAYTQQQILSDSTKGLYGLGSDAVPDDLFVSLTNCFAQILVTTSPNIVVTASLNGKTVSAMSNSSGLAILKIPSYGTWTVSANVSGTFISIDCEIKAVAQHELALTPDLEITSWDAINSANCCSLTISLSTIRGNICGFSSSFTGGLTCHSMFIAILMCVNLNNFINECFCFFVQPRLNGSRR